MEIHQAADIFEALSFTVRLSIVRLLAKNEPNGLIAGDIARTLAIPASNASFHLNAIARANLISVERQGRFLRYRANVPLLREAAAYLAETGGANTAEKARRDRSTNTNFTVAHAPAGPASRTAPAEHLRRQRPMVD